MLNTEEEFELNKIEKKEESFFFFFSFFIFLIVVAVSITIYYFNNTSLSIISESKGVIVPSSKVKVIQHLEGGIIKKINVNIGDIVKKGEVLLELEPIKTLADFSEIEKRLTTLSINISRLRAESENKKLFFSKEIKNNYPNLVKDSLQLFEVRNNKINATLEEQSNFLKNEINSLKLLEEQVLISKSLLEEQLTNRLTHLDLLKEKNSAIAKIDTTQSAIKKIKETYLTEVRTELLKEISEYEELLERKNKFKDNLNRTIIKAPEDGIIKQRFVDTLGGVIKAGTPLFEVVPIDDKLIISSKLPVDEIGYIKKFQNVSVKLLGKNNSLYEPIQGRVITISPDAIYSDTFKEEPYYEIRIETANNYFEGKNEKFFMYPGTQVLTLINIGERTISDYLLEPIFSSFEIALTEK
tara:strand:- start:8044 stop:9279 length:1236 start_codon:yes stop_codon:yes gene_type:complete